MKQLSLIVWLAAISMSACAPGSGGAADDEFTLPSGSGATSKPGGSVGQSSITGVLSFDSVEGRCGFLETHDGTRFEVVYPGGWQLDAQAGVLRGPAGERVVAGQTVTVRGSVAVGRSSTCQVGTIFQATSVRVGAG